jgi:CheY-like chemotaxis protein
VTSRRVLIIDDDDGIREVAKMSLELVAGWEVATAASGDEGLERARETQPEGILLDVMMPGMDGPATLTALRADDAVGTTPVIFLTAKVQASERTGFAEMDIAGLIAKPFDPMKLASQITDLFGWSP